MSLITDDPDDSPHHCATKHRHHHHHHGTGCRIGGTGRRRLLIVASSATTFLIALAIVLWLTLRPSSPRFTLLAATVSGPNASTTTGIARLDAAFVAHNPNARATALYDRLQLRASYGAGTGTGAISQLAPAQLPPFEQTQGDVVLSASLASTASASAVAETETEGGRSTTTLLRLRVEGQLRWKVASWVSGQRDIVADCVAVVVLKPSPVQPSRAVVVQGSQCATTIQ